MLSSILITAALAAGVMAVPLEKRDLVTEYSTRIHYNVHTVTQTVTAVATLNAGQQKDVDTNEASGDNGNSPANVAQSHVVTITAGDNQPSQVQNNFEQKRPKPVKTTESPSPAKTTQPEKSDAPSYGGSGGGTASSSGEDQTYISRVVNSHNVHRANHSVPLISWSDDLWQSAKDVAMTCQYKHQMEMQGGGYGQNIAAGVGKDNITAVISDMFYNGEIEAYEASDASSDYTVNPNTDEKLGPTTFHVWGHFTQIVWKDTTHVACYTHDCGEGRLANVSPNTPSIFTVCNYKNPGNYGGQYVNNVLKPKGDPTANWAVSM